jgi:hypothetical protein
MDSASLPDSAQAVCPSYASNPALRTDSDALSRLTSKILIISFFQILHAPVDCVEAAYYRFGLLFEHINLTGSIFRGIVFEMGRLAAAELSDPQWSHA